jgi:glutathione synthase/RimK-type ligase-like ATP-grasp enzyme
MPHRILGINARNLLYIKPSISPKIRHVLDNKLLTKKALLSAHIPVPETFAVISSQKQLRDFPWAELPSSFALKPNRGFGGEGILVVFAKKKEKVLAPRIWSYNLGVLRVFG